MLFVVLCASMLWEGAHQLVPEERGSVLDFERRKTGSVEKKNTQARLLSTGATLNREHAVLHKERGELEATKTLLILFNILILLLQSVYKDYLRSSPYFCAIPRQVLVLFLQGRRQQISHSHPIVTLTQT